MQKTKAIFYTVNWSMVLVIAGAVMTTVLLVRAKTEQQATQQRPGVSAAVLQEIARQRGSCESGFSDHVAERRGTLVDIPVIERDFTAWSGNITLGLLLGSKMRPTGEFFYRFKLGNALSRAGNLFLYRHFRTQPAVVRDRPVRSRGFVGKRRPMTNPASLITEKAARTTATYGEEVTRTVFSFQFSVSDFWF